MVEHRYIFTDTNLFEQYQPIENIDWLRVADCKAATLVVPPVTLSELNKHKDGAPRGRLKRRAANALTELSRYSRQEKPCMLRAGVELVFRHQEPLLDFGLYTLSKEVPDDRLIASALEFALENHISDGSVMVTTGDLGLELKAKGQALITPLLLPAEVRLAGRLHVVARVG